ncbi:hypothetical protein RND71_002013 [Anisodus tanguticus]|uniref:Uncharacterized protein n=1 Tax=Anisodus tanguticus TaxID=243964 RepID=A0AAE1T3C9_9SOLA|nr:hypothetical protein RND71_002013 [Anisodus tanguticus]
MRKKGLGRKHVPKVLSNGKVLTYPENTRGNGKRVDVYKNKGIKTNDNAVCFNSKFDVLNQQILEEKNVHDENEKSTKIDNPNKEIRDVDRTVANVVEDCNNKEGVECSNDDVDNVAVEFVNNNVIEELVENDDAKEVEVDNKEEHVETEVTQIEEVEVPMLTIDSTTALNTKEWVERAFVTSSEVHEGASDKTHEIGENNHHSDDNTIDTTPIAKMNTSMQVNNTTEEVVDVDRVGDQHKDEIGKGVSQKIVWDEGLEYIQHSQAELLLSSPSESNIQSYDQLMVSVDSNGVGSYPHSRREIQFDISLIDEKEKATHNAIQQLNVEKQITSPKKHCPLQELHDIVSHKLILQQKKIQVTMMILVTARIRRMKCASSFSTCGKGTSISPKSMQKCNIKAKKQSLVYEICLNREIEIFVEHTNEDHRSYDVTELDGQLQNEEGFIDVNVAEGGNDSDATSEEASHLHYTNCNQNLSDKNAEISIVVEELLPHYVHKIGRSKKLRNRGPDETSLKESDLKKHISLKASRKGKKKNCDTCGKTGHNRRRSPIIKRSHREEVRQQLEKEGPSGEPSNATEASTPDINQLNQQTTQPREQLKSSAFILSEIGEHFREGTSSLFITRGERQYVSPSRLREALSQTSKRGGKGHVKKRTVGSS